MVIDIHDVLRLELVTIVINLILEVEGAIDIVRVLASQHQGVHLSQSLIRKLHHLVDMVILFLIEVILFALILARDGASHVKAGIADRLQFRYLTQHRTNLRLCIVGEVCVTDRIKILRNLQFHVIRDTLVLLDACIELIEVTHLCAVLLSSLTTTQRQQFTYHVKHPLHTLGECLYLLLCLEDRELWGLHEASGNEMQTEILFLVHLLWFDNPAHEFLYLWDKPYQDECVHHIKACMEGSQYETQFGGIGEERLSTNSLLCHRDIIAHEAADHIHKGTEDKQYPDDAEDIKEHVCKGSPSCLCVR